MPPCSISRKVNIQMEKTEEMNSSALIGDCRIVVLTVVVYSLQQPKVFSGFKFFFTSDFLPSYKGYLQQLATAAGGTILLRKPVSSNNQSSSCSSPNCQVFIIYSLELPGQCNPGEKNEILNRRRSNAEVLAKSATAKVATNLWLLNSIASSKLRSLVE